MSNKTKILARMGIIAALYATLTLLFAFISFSTSGFQVRVSESLTILPLFFPESIIGLFVGCLISNIISGSVLDVFIGSLSTLIAAVLTYSCSFIKNVHLRIIAGIMPPILVNAFVVPITYTILASNLDMYFAEVLVVGLGQLVAVGGIGTIFYYAMLRIEKRWIKK